MKKYLYIVLIIACLIPAGTSAQTHRGGGQRPAVDRIESLKKVRLMETLKLDENQSLKLITRYNAHRETMMALDGEFRDLVDKLDSQIRAKASDAEFNQTFGAMRELDRRKSEARTKFFNEIRDVLTVRQVAEYFVFERNFARDLREAVKDVKMDQMKNR